MTADNDARLTAAIKHCRTVGRQYVAEILASARDKDGGHLGNAAELADQLDQATAAMFALLGDYRERRRADVLDAAERFRAEHRGQVTPCSAAKSEHATGSSHDR